MGCGCSFDNLPPVPDHIKEDPSPDSPVTVAVARLGFFGFSRDYGIWENLRPNTSDEQKQAIWLWFNKSTLGPNNVQIDLENFHRGKLPDKPDKGQVLYSAYLQERPHFETYQRFAGGCNTRIYGFYSGDHGNYHDEPDDFYTNNPKHRGKFDDFHVAPPHIITKWDFLSKVTFRPGNTGRGQMLGNIPVILDVYSKGTVVTSYGEKPDPDPERQGQKIHAKFETEFVDRIEFRLTYNNMLMGQWFVEGDTHQHTGDVNLDSPFFSTIVEGGWFTRSTFRCTTMPTMDPALAMLISHVCASEFSVAEVKNDLQVPTPGRKPSSLDSRYAFRPRAKPLSQPQGTYNMYSAHPVKQPYHGVKPISPRPQQPMMTQGQQPMMQGQQPMMYNQQPMQGQQPMMMQGQQPMMMQGQQPMMQGQQPMMMQGQQPMMQGQQPMMMQGQQPTMMQGQQPMMQGQQPVMYNQQPMQGQQPMMMQGQQPMMQGQQPMMYNQQPMQGQQPMMQGQQPMMQGQQPMMYNQQPMMQGQQPMMQGQQYPQGQYAQPMPNGYGQSPMHQ